MITRSTPRLQLANRGSCWDIAEAGAKVQYGDYSASVYRDCTVTLRLVRRSLQQDPRRPA